MFLSQCPMEKMDVDVIDGSLESASPCPSENKLWLQGTLILGAYTRDLVIPVCQIRAHGQGLPPVMLNFEYLKL
jgi:hypothetical protein